MKQVLKRSLFFWLVLAGGTGILIYCLIFWAEERNPFLNFGVVEEGKIYRSALPGAGDLKFLKEKYGINTIISLKGKEEDSLKELMKELGINLVGIQFRAHRPPKIEELKLLGKIFNQERINYSAQKPLLKDWLGKEGNSVLKPPFLIHCQMGADRTGYLVAVYRICFQGWEVEKARREMLRYFHFPARYPKLWESLNQLEPREFCPKINSQYQG